MTDLTVKAVALRFLQLLPTRRQQVISDLGLTEEGDPPVTERTWQTTMLQRVIAAGKYEEFVAHPSMFGPVHWTGAAPTSLHGNGAASFQRTTTDRRAVTCPLCLSLLEREDVAASEAGDTPHDRENYARLSCNMNDATATVMAARHDNEGISYTEQVRRGIAIYDCLATETAAGATIHLTYPDGRQLEVTLLP